MEIITHAARILVGAHGITFVLRDGDRCYYAEEDAISPLWKGRRFPVSACISGWCMIERRSAIIPDIYEDDRIPRDAYRPTFVRSLVMVPVCQDNPIAAMGAYWASTRQIPVDEIEQLQTLANVAGMALAHVELQQERARNLLRDELQHRVRNSFTVIQSIVRHGLHGDAERAASINGRIAALARADGLLTSNAAVPNGLKAVLLSELASLWEGRFCLSGEDFTIPRDRAQALALVVHELATNAAKHGAFATPKGQVSVRWTVTGDEANVIWEESGGPNVAAPKNHGFGTLFMDQVLAGIGGEMRTEWHQTGIVREIRFRLGALKQTAAGN